MSLRFAILGLCVLGLALFGQSLKPIGVYAEEQTDTTTPETETETDVIDGTSDEFNQDEKEGWTILTGNVKINRENGFLNADKVTIYRDVDTGEAMKTVAEGNVELRDGEVFATCDHAIIDHVTDIVELESNVVVKQNEDELEADHFTYNRRTGKREGKGNIRFKVRLVSKKAPEGEPTEEPPTEEPNND